MSRRETREEVTPDPITITHEQAATMIEVCKDIQARIPANGMPELDQDLHEMIALLEEAASGGVVPPPGGEELPLSKKIEDPVKPIIDPARPPEKDQGPGHSDTPAPKVEPKFNPEDERNAPKHKAKEEHIEQAKEHTEATLKELKAEQQDRREEYSSHQAKTKHR